MNNQLRRAVGRGEPNRPEDVLLVQQLLNHQSSPNPSGTAFEHSAGTASYIAPVLGMRVPEDGRFSQALEITILAFQRRLEHTSFPSGVVQPGGLTFLRLTQNSFSFPRPSRRRLVLPPNCGEVTLTSGHYREAAQNIGCEVRSIKAVAHTESSVNAFTGPAGRPTIRYERHVFHKESYGRYTLTYPDISWPTQGGGSPPQVEWYDRLTRAYALDEDAALKATSWGLFQIMGFNHMACGFATVYLYVYAMCTSVQEQLRAFTQFILSDKVLHTSIINRDWGTFARHYNGKAQTGVYSSRMATNYQNASND